MSAGRPFRRLFHFPWRSREQIRTDVDEEIRFHLDMRVEELVRRGHSASEARGIARREFGDLDEARSTLRLVDDTGERRSRRAQWWDALRQDTRFALRGYARSPVFTVAALATLALGIGANTAIFSVVDAVLIRPAPFPDPDRLVVVWETDRNSGTSHEPASVPDFVDFRERSSRFASLAGFIPRETSFLPDDGEAVRLPALAVSDGFTETLGIQPILGRTFTVEETEGTAPEGVLIGEALWERRFGRDPTVLGRTLRLDEGVYPVLGVLPRGADFGLLQLLSVADYGRSFADGGEGVQVEVWLPLQTRTSPASRESHPMFVVGRLAEGASLDAAQGEMSTIAAELERQYTANTARGVYLEPLMEVVVGPVRPALLLLLGAVALVLLIACANVTNLLLARGAARSREVAVRAALGAGKGRLARQFVVESLVLALAAAALGVALAFGGLELLLLLAPSDLPRLSEAGVSLRALGLTLLVSVGVGVAFGVLPGLQARPNDLQSALRSGGTGAGRSRGRRGAQSMLVVGEVGLAVLLLIGSGLVMKSLWRIIQVDPGFQTERVLKADYQLPAARYPSAIANWPNWSEIQGFNTLLLERAESLPGVESVAIAGVHPLSAGFTNSFVVVGREAESADWPEISIRQVSPDYFSTVGVPLLEGRLPREGDGTTAEPVLVINQAAAERFFTDQLPLGRKIAFWGTPRTIVGVVGNERFMGVTQDAPPAVYLALAQAPATSGSLLIRTTGSPEALAGMVRSMVAEIDPTLAVFGVEALGETLSRSLGARRFTALLLGLFAALALTLAIVGVHGVLNYSVAQRTREIGIRMAMGASRGSVTGMVLGQGMRLIILGVSMGLVGAWLLSRLLRGLLFGVSATDPAVFAGVAGLLVLVALLASWLPARRATRVDPMVALRTE
ncbi:MAG: ABC transporter permease [Gemmatimonadota bacterium]